MSRRQNSFLCIALMAVVLFPSVPYAKGIEVIIAGKSYDSIDAYRSSKRNPILPQAASLEEVDTKTTQAVDQLKSVSSEQSVSLVKADFAQNWDNPTPKFNIESQELEKRLEAIADNRKEPVLVVSENGKLRVMLMNENQPPATPGE